MSAEGATTAEHHGKDARRLHTAGMNPLANASRLSRRDLIKGGACALAGSSGLANSFDSHEADSILKPFSFRALRPCQAGPRGVPLASPRSLPEYWRTEYNWRRCESTLNGFAQYRTMIDGLGIHFIHVRSPHSDALPLIITHGSPKTSWTADKL